MIRDIYYCTVTGRANYYYILRHAIYLSSKHISKFLIVDTGSTDDTRTLPLQFQNVATFSVPNWTGDKTVVYTRLIQEIPDDAWFLLVEPDEIPSQELLNNIQWFVECAEREGANTVSIPLNEHLVDWDGNMFPTVQDKRRIMLIKKVMDDASLKAYNVQPPAYCNVYKSSYTLARDEFLKLMNEPDFCLLKEKHGIQNVSQSIAALDNDAFITDVVATILLDEQMQKLLITYRKKEAFPRLCYDACCSYDTVEEKILQCAMEELRRTLKPNMERTPDEELDDSFMIVNISNNRITVEKEAGLFKDRAERVIKFMTQVCEVYHKPINGRFRIGLHDKYDDKEYSDIMVFSRDVKTEGQILIPDNYAMYDYYGYYNDSVSSLVHKQDKMPFDEKKDKAFFVGVSSGDIDPRTNTRLRLCDWAIKHKDIAQCHISKIVQMDESQVRDAYPMADAFIIDDHIDVMEQRKYKYLIDVDGNTCAWDRLPWILASNSLCLKQKSTKICWYYPLLTAGIHYVPFDTFDDICDVVANNRNDVHQIIKNANLFVKHYLYYNSHLTYMGHILHLHGSFGQTNPSIGMVV